MSDRDPITHPFVTSGWVIVDRVLVELRRKVPTATLLMRDGLLVLGAKGREIGEPISNDCWTEEREKEVVSDMLFMLRMAGVYRGTVVTPFGAFMIGEDVFVRRRPHIGDY